MNSKRFSPRPAGGSPAGQGRHVLVARLDNLGDVVLAGPAVRAAAAGAARVTVLCGPAGRAAADLLPGVDDVIEWEAPWVPLQAPPVDAGAVAALVERLRGAAIDDAVVLTSFHQSPLPLALLLRLAGVDRIAAVSVDHAGSLLDARLPYDDRAHEVTQGLAVAAALGYHLPAGDDSGLHLRSLPSVEPPAGGERYVVIHPGASVPARSLPPALLGPTVDELIGRGWAVVRTGTAGEAAGWPLAPQPGLIDRAGRTTLAELAAVVAGADAVVCGNTAAAHLAAATGTPVAWVFAPVVARRRWHPWRVPHRVLGDQTMGCSGCRSRQCPLPGQPCLAPVTALAVADAVDLLARRPQPEPIV